MKPIASLLFAASAAALLAGCGERVLPAPAPAAPDTALMGAGPGFASCGAPVPVEEVLRRINAVRASGYRCGRRAMPPAGPLKWDPALHSAAQGHSLDMARRSYFKHRSPEGRDVGSRAAAVRYPWKTVGENIAAGKRSTPDAVQGWLDSAGHCENILNPEFQDVAMACVANPGSEWGSYWTMVLGRR